MIIRSLAALAALTLATAGLVLAPGSAQAFAAGDGGGGGGLNFSPVPLPAGDRAVVRGELRGLGDRDTYSFFAQEGDYVYAATMTLLSDDDVDSQLTLWRAPVQVNQGQQAAYAIEIDDNDGSFGEQSSSIAGARIPATGTYYLVVDARSQNARTHHPYTLYFRLQQGAPAPGNPPALLPSSGWISGTLPTGTAADAYIFSANAGDTVFLSLDLDPERDGTIAAADSRLSVIPVDNGGDLRYLTADDVSQSTSASMSEALFITVRSSGQYIVAVDSTIPPGSPQTYTLSVTKFPQSQPAGICKTYTSTDVPKTIGPNPGLVSSTITVPGNPRIADIDVAVQIDHAHMSDVDAHLRSPAGNTVGLFTDIGSSPGFTQTRLDLTFDDDAATPPQLTWLQAIRYMPEREYRLSWFDGVIAGGTWTLDLRDDEAANAGVLTGWSMRICELPPPPSTCPPGFAMRTVYSTDFEFNDGGFTHDGNADEWQRGLPTYAPLDTCNSGAACWKTDLYNTYNPNSSQTLRSPRIDLTGYSPPVVVRWAQQYQLEDLGYDGYWAGAREAGNSVGNITLFQWNDRTIGDDLAGNPEVRIPQAAGWSEMSALADPFAGKNMELEFRLSSSEATQFAGVAIDDVSVSACRALSADLAITKTDGVATADPGSSVTYTITASNAGPGSAMGAIVTDYFPLACTSVNWTCVGSGGGTCSASGLGSFNDVVNLPVGASVTYTANCAVSPSAFGTLSNSATVTAPGDMPDLVQSNNTATDTDALSTNTDLSITLTDGVSSAVPGQSVTYTIKASNSGPLNAPGAIITDYFPIACASVSWTCVGSGGATCSASGTGSFNDVVNLPSGGAVTYTAQCAVAPSATGTLSNDVYVTAPSSVRDPIAANNRATDTDALTPRADLAIAQSNGLTSVIPGQSVTYTITANNAGPSNAAAAVVTDIFPAACTTVSWTCTSAGGGSCAASGSGNLNETVSLPIGARVTFAATCAVSTTATGTLSNTASVAAPIGVVDSQADNNASTDADTLVPISSLPKTDLVAGLGSTFTAPGSTVVLTSGNPVPGGTITYAISAWNFGATPLTGATVVNAFPAACTTVNWTCAATTGAACTASGSGNINDSVNLPARGIVRYTAICAISPTATGTLSDTVTVATPVGVIDTNPNNNRLTQTLTLRQ